MWSWIRKLIFILTLGGMGVSSAYAVEHSPLVVVASPQLTFGQLHRQDVLNIFLLRRHMDQKGQAFVVYGITPENEALFTQFVQHCLRWNPAILARKWERAIYTGEGQAPYVAETWKQLHTLLLNQTIPGVGVLPLRWVPPSFKVIYRCEKDSNSK